MGKIGKQRERISWSRVAPVAMVHPGGFLAVLAAVLGPATTTAFCKLPLELFPFAAFVVRALADAAARFILAAQVSHHHTRPVPHVFRVVSDGKFLDQREDVHIIREEIFILFRNVNGRGVAAGVIQHAELTIDLELWH